MSFRKYPVNLDFLGKWSEDMAYCLGFIMADGSVSKYTLSIEIKRKDVEVLEFVKSKMSPASLIEKTIRIDKDTKVKRFYARLRINSIDLNLQLSNFGIIPNKTGKEKMDFDMPNQYFPHYIRGVFDGDGWVYTRRNMIESGICSASSIFLEQLKERCGGLGKIRAKKKKGQNSILYSWEMGKGDALKFKDLIYTPKSFSLKRKKEIFFSDFYIRSKYFWTNKQLDVLLKKYKPGAPLSPLAKEIGRSYKAVSKKIWELELAKVS